MNKIIANRLKYNLKKCISLLLDASGAADYLLKKKAANKCTILMYHRVLPESIRRDSDSNAAITVSVKSFITQMEYISKNYQPITIDRLYQHLASKKQFNENNILVTFDDGWRDNYEYAMPVLTSNNISSLIFLSTGFIGKRKRFWQEQFTALIKEMIKNGESSENMSYKIIKILNKYGLKIRSEGSHIQISEMISLYVEHLKTLEYHLIARIMREIENLQIIKKNNTNKIKKKINDFMNWKEITEMKNSGIKFGSHGVNHLILNKKDVDVDYEIYDSKKEIEEKLGTPVNTISYPNGDYSDDVIDQAKFHGYTMGFGTEQGLNTHLSNPYALKRINIHENACSTLSMFKCRLLGLW